MSRADAGKVWTIGHSVRPWEEFVGMLIAAKIQSLADVRRFAGSRRNPHFSGEAMRADLAKEGIDYLPMPELGGRRSASAASRNLAWRNAGFRGYADYMMTPPYRDALENLAKLALHSRTAVMCAEAMWWQCHRSLISDDLKASGWEVIHLLSPGREQEHPYTSAARIVDGRLDYTLPADPQASLF
ncbi:MAG: DUF488 domain-containing protein [Pseudoxanthomonas sp.]